MAAAPASSTASSCRLLRSDSVARIIADKTGKPVYLKRRPRITSRRDGFIFAGN